ncbi:MAG: nucleotidyltransferase domain-containing protein [Candidatus Aminicenantes bacterium]|nr:MAG: nucleotidyltransferase domain-containing protein [Candidatus Aminicenantes bacterium]
MLTGSTINSILDSMGTTAAVIDIEKVKAYLREKEKNRQQKHQEEFQQTAKKLKELGHIWKKYNINKVYLYGSLAQGKIHNQSDIDIAVEGNISYQQLLSLFTEVDRHFSREIDIRILEELPFREAIREKGVMVYGK